MNSLRPGAVCASEANTRNSVPGSPQRVVALVRQFSAAPYSERWYWANSVPVRPVLKLPHSAWFLSQSTRT